MSNFFDDLAYFANKIHIGHRPIAYVFRMMTARNREMDRLFSGLSPKKRSKGKFKTIQVAKGIPDHLRRKK